MVPTAMRIVEAILIGVALLALLEALYSLYSGFQLLRLFRKFCGRPPGDYAPPVSLVVPCKDVDPGLEENLRAYLEQNYPDYQLLLVTGDPGDPCVPILRGLHERYPRVRSEILFSGKARGRSQKVHNLIHAVRFIRAEDRVIAFGDSDIRPGSSWLRYLVSPLKDASVGLSTGFRWYLPQRGGFASILRSVWNAGVVSLMRERGCFFAWGGAMAIRREVFERCRVVEHWRNALSDDYAISHAVQKGGRSIHFQPPCLSFSYEDCNWKELRLWCVRQISITRVYHPALWTMAFMVHLLNVLAIWGGAFFVALRLLAGPNPPWVLPALLGAIYLCGCVKSWMRLKAITLLFPEHGPELMKHAPAYTLWGPLAAVLSLRGLVRSLLTREIEWRGIRYRMLSPTNTVVLE